MSRVGKREIIVPESVELTIDGTTVTVKGPKGTLTQTFTNLVEIKNEDGKILVARKNEEKHTKQLHGTTNALINNMVEGVTKGYTKEIIIKGVGYKASLKGNTLVVLAGYSHDVQMEVPEGIEVELKSATEIKISGIDKQKVGQFSVLVRDIRRPNPYSGKGIMFKDQVVRRKEGKKSSK